MDLTGNGLTADAVRQYIGEKRAAEDAKRASEAEALKGERDKLHAEFMAREIKPEAMDRVASMIRRAIDMGEREALLGRFPSSWLKDRGRSIANADPRWPDSLDGVARRAFEFYEVNLKPRGFQMRAEILEWPGGMPGDVGLFLQWKHPDEV